MVLPTSIHLVFCRWSNLLIWSYIISHRSNSLASHMMSFITWSHSAAHLIFFRPSPYHRLPAIPAWYSLYMPHSLIPWYFCKCHVLVLECPSSCCHPVYPRSLGSYFHEVFCRQSKISFLCTQWLYYDYTAVKLFLFITVFILLECQSLLLCTYSLNCNHQVLFCKYPGPSTVPKTL